MNISFDIRPAWRTIVSNRLVLGILLFEVILAVAVTSNTMAIIFQRLSTVVQATGIKESGLYIIQSRPLAAVDDAVARSKSDLNAISRVAGVISAASINGVPLGEDSFMVAASQNPDGGSATPVNVYYGSPGFIETLGVDIVRGASFAKDGYVELDSGDNFSGLGGVGQVIISQSLANRMFSGDAVGKAIFFSSSPGHVMNVVGVAKDVLRPSLVEDRGTNYYSEFIPVIPDGKNQQYLMRVDSPDVSRVCADVRHALADNNPRRIISECRPFDDVKNHYFSGAYKLLWMMSAGTVFLLVITSFGVAGLMGYWLEGRKKELGIRRALGARKLDLIKMAQLEGGIVCGSGIACGALLALAANQLTGTWLSFERIPVIFIVLSMSVIFLISMVSALFPILRASLVSPIEAIRCD
ncbi:MAG: ABC transporter permease [Pseudoxanthomonas sp.]